MKARWAILLICSSVVVLLGGCASRQLTPQEAPVTGYVVDLEGDKVVTDLGRENVRSGDMLVIFEVEREIYHPITTELVRVRLKPVGYAEAEEVGDISSSGKIVQEGEAPLKMAQFVRAIPTQSIPIPSWWEEATWWRSLGPDGVSTIPPRQTVEWVNPKDGAVMVYVPAGEFVMGTTDAEIDALVEQFAYRERSAFTSEQPQHRVYLDGYWIYKHEVTTRQYRQFAQETGRAMPRGHQSGRVDDHPIFWVSWYDAVAYCQWAGVTLPTEAQWEKAARGTDGRIWPWGNNAPDGTGHLLANYDPRCVASGNEAFIEYVRGNYREDGHRYEGPVGDFPLGASPYGVMDMAGNIWEWCIDAYEEDFYAKSPTVNPVAGDPIDFTTNDFMTVKAPQVVRGGGWTSFPERMRTAFRHQNDPAGRRFTSVGFRGVLNQDVRSSIVPVRPAYHQGFRTKSPQK